MEYHPERRINKQIPFLSTVGEESGCMFLMGFVGKILHHVFLPHLWLHISCCRHPVEKNIFSSLHLRRNAADQFRNHQIHLEKTIKSMGFLRSIGTILDDEIWFHKTPPPSPKKTGKLFKETNARCFHVFLAGGWGGVGRSGTAVLF